MVVLYSFVARKRRIFFVSLFAIFYSVQDFRKDFTQMETPKRQLTLTRILFGRGYCYIILRLYAYCTAVCVFVFWLVSWDRQTHAFSDIYPNISAEVYDADNCILFERQFISYIEKLISIWLLLVPRFSSFFVICIVVVVVGHILFARICLQRANNPSHIGTLAYTLKFSHAICEGMEVTKSKTNAKTQHFLHNNLTGCRLIIFFAAAQFFFLLFALLLSVHLVKPCPKQSNTMKKKQSSADLIFKKNCEYLKQNSQHTHKHKEEKSGTATKKNFPNENMCAVFFSGARCC